MGKEKAVSISTTDVKFPSDLAWSAAQKDTPFFDLSQRQEMSSPTKVGSCLVEELVSSKKNGYKGNTLVLSFDVCPDTNSLKATDIIVTI